MGSVLTKREGARWFAPIAGVSSMSSALAGYFLGHLVQKFGISSLLLMTAGSIIASLIFAEKAYHISEVNGFDPAKENTKFQKAERDGKEGKNSFRKAADLFKRVPTLQALFLETLACQGLSTVMNVAFVTQAKATFEVDASRATWMGRFYSLANLSSGFFQFGVIPRIMPLLEPRHCWIFMPAIMTAFNVLQFLNKNSSLFIVSLGFLSMKTLEYSLRGVVNEMLYVPLDFESRYVGKEVIGMFGYRLGKSGTSIALTVLARMMGNFNIDSLMSIATVSSSIWLFFALRLSDHVPLRRAGATKKRN